MEHTLTAFLDSYGYLALTVVGFAEFAGVPIASVPVMILAGALVASAALNPALVVLCVVAGALVADASWFLMVRWQGDRLVDAACGLTSSPDACVTAVGERVAKLGPAYVVPAKFIPGAGNLVAAGAALARMQPIRFVLYDGLALLLWASVWTGIGRLFANQVQGVVVWVEDYQRAALLVTVGLVAAAGAWRGVRVIRHRTEHR